MTWSFAWLRSWDEVWATQHVADWQQLCERPDAYATPFMHPDLLGAWLEVIGQRTESNRFFLHAKHRDGQEYCGSWSGRDRPGKMAGHAASHPRATDPAVRTSATTIRSSCRNLHRANR